MTPLRNASVAASGRSTNRAELLRRTFGSRICRPWPTFTRAQQVRLDLLELVVSLGLKMVRKVAFLASALVLAVAGSSTHVAPEQPANSSRILPSGARSAASSSAGPTPLSTATPAAPSGAVLAA